MMRLWLTEYARSQPLSPSATFSVALHVMLIAAAVAATGHQPGMARDALANHVYYLPPPDHVAPTRGQREVLHYIALAPTSVPTFDASHATRHLQRDPGPSIQPVEAPVTQPPVANTDGADSVMSVLDVDSAVTRYINSAAPAFPPDMLERNIEGSVFARYVVDTTGLADTTSLRILQSTNPSFVAAVREALPYMRFHPAKIGNKKVRQLVEQTFSFRIRRPPPDTVTRPGLE
jgi:outer membrane biosynthesis protein TonB